MNSKIVKCGQCGCDTVRLRATRATVSATCTKCGETTDIRAAVTMVFMPASPEQGGCLIPMEER